MNRTEALEVVAEAARKARNNLLWNFSIRISDELDGALAALDAAESDGTTEREKIVACLMAFAESAEEEGRKDWGVIYRSAADAIKDGAHKFIERGEREGGQ